MVPISLNRMLRQHWAVRRRYNQRWYNAVAYTVLLEHGPLIEPVTDRRRLSIWLHRKRLLDPDNATASVKPIVDAMCRTGLIVDDSEKYIHLEVVQVTDKPEKTVIEVWK